MPNMLFKALSDPNRRRILEVLSQKGDLSAGEIGLYFSTTAPTLSHHLQVLKAANLVNDERAGKNIVYSLNTTVFQEIIQWFYTVMEDDKANEKKSIE